MEVILRAERGRPQGSRASRRLRADGKVPAVLYGRDVSATPVAVDARELYRALHTEAGLNVLISIALDGDDSHVTLARQIQRHPVRGDIIHVDFVKISLTETVEADTPLELLGVPVGVTRDGGIVDQLRPVVRVEALPTDIPASIELDISLLEVGDVLRIEDLPVIEGVEYLDDPDTPLVTVALPAAEIAEEEPEEEEELELEEGEEAPVEGEEEEAGEAEEG